MSTEQATPSTNAPYKNTSNTSKWKSLLPLKANDKLVSAHGKLPRALVIWGRPQMVSAHGKLPRALTSPHTYERTW